MSSLRTPPFVVDHVPVHGVRSHTDFIVLHTTEGLGTIPGYASYFRGSRDKLGSTFLTDRQGRIGKYAELNQITYHVRHHNSTMIGIEQQGFAGTSRADWLKKYRRQLFATAWTMAHISVHLGIPLIIAGDSSRRLRHSAGVLQHAWVPDNDHVDCGHGYPMDFVMHWAQKWAKGTGPTLATRVYIKTGIRPLAPKA